MNRYLKESYESFFKRIICIFPRKNHMYLSFWITKILILSKRITFPLTSHWFCWFCVEIWARRPWEDLKDSYLLIHWTESFLGRSTSFNSQTADVCVYGVCVFDSKRESSSFTLDENAAQSSSKGTTSHLNGGSVHTRHISDVFIL